jgi:dihydrofolate synthase / folylpolyglutamate synthase
MGSAYQQLLVRLEEARALGVAFGLDRVRTALMHLGSPERALPAVHIAGTNGKGSTAAMAESILRASGLRTGLFTSPHLCRFTERIRLDGREVDGDHLAALERRVARSGVPLTYFEIATVLAFLTMAEAAVEVAVLEAGLGGRLDATNVCRPVATAITSVGLDHTDLLGTTLADVAREKAGIAKRDVPLFLGALPQDAADAVVQVARAAGASLHRRGIDFGPPPVPPALAGAHQGDNAALAVALAEQAVRAAGRSLAPAAIRKGLQSVVWPGRLEEVMPGVVLDGAHNPEGARALLAALPPTRPRALVISVVRGKQADAIVAALAPAFDAILVTRSGNERALPPEALVVALPAPAAAIARVLPDPMLAFDEARRWVGPAGVVVVAGSLFLVGEIRARLLGENVDPLPGGDPMR